MSDLTTLAQHAQTQAANADLSDPERVLWWQIAEEVIDYLGTEITDGEVTLERGFPVQSAMWDEPAKYEPTDQSKGTKP